MHFTLTYSLRFTCQDWNKRCDSLSNEMKEETFLMKFKENFEREKCVWSDSTCHLGIFCKTRKLRGIIYTIICKWLYKQHDVQTSSVLCCTQKKGITKLVTSSVMIASVFWNYQKNRKDNLQLRLFSKRSALHFSRQAKWIYDLEMFVNIKWKQMRILNKTV